jgi:hypothetical protein
LKTKIVPTQILKDGAGPLSFDSVLDIDRPSPASMRMKPRRRNIIRFFFFSYVFVSVVRGFPNQAGSCAGIGGSSHDRKDALTVLPNVTMRANRHLTLVQNKETVVMVDDDVTDDGNTIDVFLELLTGDGQVPFKGALIRVEQVYAASTSQNDANNNNLLTTATATTSMEQSFELRPQSSNAQASNLCWNTNPQLVQAVTHKSPAPKQSMSAVLSVTTTDRAALPVIFAIDVTVVIANNATMSMYGLQSFRLRLDRPPSPLSNAPPITDAASTDSVVVVDPDNNVAVDDHRVYPELNTTGMACQLCSNSREKLRYPDATVRWNGTDMACATLSSVASPSHLCRIAQELVQDDDAACGGCRSNTDCALPCDNVDPRGTVPILGRTIDCHLLTESLDVLLTVRTCAVSQALVRAHCGCRSTDINDGLETTSSSTSSSVRQQNDNSKPTLLLLFLPISLLLSLL